MNMLRILFREQTNARFPTTFRKRFFSEKSLEPAQEKPVKDGVDDSHASIHRRLYAPTDFERKLLVWTKKFKTVEEIPRLVPVETIELCKSKARIKVCNYMILATILGCFFMAWSGKQAAKRGESVHQMNLDWHKSMNEAKK